MNKMSYVSIFEEKRFGVSETPTIVTMKTCASNCKEDCKVYQSPLNQCNNASRLFPNDPQWGTLDWKDQIYNGSILRTFYLSSNGTCTTATDNFTIPLNEAVGPIGDPRPCGTFTLS